MNITCKDLLSMEELHSCKLLTGDVGLDNVISFPLLMRGIGEDILLMENEFVVIAEPLTLLEETKLLHFIDYGQEKKIAGILIFPNSENSCAITENVISRAKDAGIPLFVSEWNETSSDVIRVLSLRINDAKLRCNTLELTLREIFFFRNDEETMQKLLCSDLENSDYRLIRIQLFHYDEYCRDHGFTNRVSMHEHKMFIKKLLMNQIKSEFPNRPFCSHKEIIILLYQEKNSASKKIVAKLKKIKDYLENMFPGIDLRYCVTRTYDQLRDIPQAFHETFYLTSLTNIEPFRNRIVTYSGIGIYQLFLDIPKRVLADNYRMIMRPLLEYDSENHADLLSTLQVYLSCNLNIDETAQEMFIHKNTIRYRLKKIEEAMGCSLKSCETITMLYYCLSIYNYLNT